MPDYLLDTNLLILHLRRRPQATALLVEWSETSQLYISVVTRTEILAGMHPHEEERTLLLLNSLPNLPLTITIADQAGRLIYQYARQGVQLSLPDAHIAATALQHNLTLATSNAKHFPMAELSVYSFS